MVKHALLQHVGAPAEIHAPILHVGIPVIHAPSPRARHVKHVLPVSHADLPAVRARVSTPAGIRVRLTAGNTVMQLSTFSFLTLQYYQPTNPRFSYRICVQKFNEIFKDNSSFHIVFAHVPFESSEENRKL